jgi:hypothetical protein
VHLAADMPYNIGAEYWFPDGSSILFSLSPFSQRGPSRSDGRLSPSPEDRPALTKLPDSEKRIVVGGWSPNGRHVLGQPRDLSALFLFDWFAQQWSELAAVPALWPTWSQNGDYVYYLSPGLPLAIRRLSVRDRRIPEVASLKNLRIVGGMGSSWLGLTPDNQPLVMLDLGFEDIYALDWKAP